MKIFNGSLSDSVIPKLCVPRKFTVSQKPSKFSLLKPSKMFHFKLSKLSLLNCQKLLFNLSKFSISNCQNFLFQTVKIFYFKLSICSFSNCQNFPFQTVKIFLFQTVKIFFFKLSKNFIKNPSWSVALEWFPEFFIEWERQKVPSFNKLSFFMAVREHVCLNFNGFVFYSVQFQIGVSGNSGKRLVSLKSF